MTIFLILLLVVLIAGACGSARSTARQLMLCAAGGLVIAAALLSPLHELADRYISAHMLQHELLMVLAAPLLALARPQMLLLSLLRQRARRFAARVIGRLRMGMAAHGCFTHWLYGSGMCQASTTLPCRGQFFMRRST